MRETLTSSPRGQQFIPNGNQGAVAQDMEMASRYMTEFEFDRQQHEEYEYTVLEDRGQISQYGKLMSHKVNLSLKQFNIVSS
ncbi:unnamed protein product [Caenorhabditis brenneri]